MSEWRAQLWQDGIVVARVWGPSEDRVRQEIQHYAAQYEQDGPVKVVVKAPRKERTR